MNSIATPADNDTTETVAAVREHRVTAMTDNDVDAANAALDGALADAGITDPA